MPHKPIFKLTGKEEQELCRLWGAFGEARAPLFFRPLSGTKFSGKIGFGSLEITFPEKLGTLPRQNAPQANFQADSAANLTALTQGPGTPITVTHCYVKSKPRKTCFTQRIAKPGILN